MARRVSIPSRGFWFFEGCCVVLGVAFLTTFQSPRGDFGFLKRSLMSTTNVRGDHGFQSPRGDFGFLKPDRAPLLGKTNYMFQSPRGDFGFLKGSNVV